MSFNLTGYKIFLGSPSGLESEREAIRACATDFNNSEAMDKEAYFQVFGWEDVPPDTGRPQEIINRSL